MNKPNKVFQNITVKTKSTDEDKREIEAIASVQKKDRDNDILYLDGLDIANFKQNPVILWSHDSSQPPIARATKVWVEGKQLKLKMQFPTSEEYSFADTIYKLVKGGYINNLSVGFKPDYEKTSFNEKNRGYEFKAAELLEVSIVNIPANSGAKIITRSLDDAVKSNVIDDIERKEVELMLNDLKDVEQVTTEQESQSEKIAEQNITNKDNEIETLKNQIAELQSQVKSLVNKSSEADTTDDDLYNWVFEENLDFVSSKDDSNETDALIEEVLNDLGINE
jgi:HK97 family phage prohead protease